MLDLTRGAVEPADERDVRREEGADHARGGETAELARDRAGAAPTFREVERHGCAPRSGRAVDRGEHAREVIGRRLDGPAETGEGRRRRAELLELGRARGTAREVGGDCALVDGGQRVEGMEGEGVAAVVVRHAWSSRPPTSRRRSVRRFSSPSRALDFTVPSGAER